MSRNCSASRCRLRGSGCGCIPGCMAQRLASASNFERGRHRPRNTHPRSFSTNNEQRDPRDLLAAREGLAARRNPSSSYGYPAAGQHRGMPAQKSCRGMTGCFPLAGRLESTDILNGAGLPYAPANSRLGSCPSPGKLDRVVARTGHLSSSTRSADRGGSPCCCWRAQTVTGTSSLRNNMLIAIVLGSLPTGNNPARYAARP
jgi:hypothetical protein